MSIIRTEAYYHSTNGEDMIRAVLWRNDEVYPIGIFQIAHGLTEHMNRYDRFARFLAENGFVVCGNDHLGHGKAAAQNGKLGDFGAVGTDVRMVDDMNVLSNIMKKKYPGIPYFIFGHSLGSLLARIYASMFGDDLSGLILCGSTDVTSKISVLQDYVLPFGELIGGEKYSTAGADLLGKITSKYFKEDDENSWLSVSKENRAEADADPYFDYPITNASSMIVAKILLKASDEMCYSMIPTYLPVFLISGAKDPISMFGRNVLNICDKLEANGIETEMKLYPGLRHEILNEDDYQHIYDDILNWTTNKLKGDFI